MSLSDSSGEETARIKARQDKLGEDQPSVRRDPVALYNMVGGQLTYPFDLLSPCALASQHMPSIVGPQGLGCMPFAWDNGNICTNADLFQHLCDSRNVLLPLQRQIRDQCVGARREFYACQAAIQMIAACSFPVCHGTKAHAQFIHGLTAEEWGQDAEHYMKALKVQSFKRHHQIAKKSAFLST